VDVTVDTVLNELTDKIVEQREMRTDTVGSSCGGKEKAVDNTPVEIEMLQAEDASFVKESLGIGSYSVCGGEGWLRFVAWFSQYGIYIEAGADLAAAQKFDAEESKNNTRMLAAAVPEVMVSTSRASPRLVRSSDEHTLSEQN